MAADHPTLGDVPRLLLVGLREVAMMLAGRYARSEGAHGLVRNAQGEILLVKPIFPPREWNLPGGKVGKREAPHIAAAREVREETGIVVVVDRCILVDGTRPGSTDFVFACRPVGGRLRPQPEEIAEVRWVAQSRIEALEPKLAELLARLGGNGTSYRGV